MKYIIFYLLPLLCLGSESAIITVQGEGVIYKPADQVSFSAATVTEGEDPEVALNKNNQQMNNVVQALKNLGISEDDIQTGQFSLTPIYAPQSQNTSREWEPKITGYRVTNQLTITTNQLNLVGSLISEVTKAGAGDVSQLNYDLKNKRLYREEAITKATANAIEDAKHLSSAANLELIRIKKIRLDDTNMSPVSRNFALASKSVPVFEGQIPIQATVHLEIEADQ
ncbi:MAG: SIMPL domain-containing protein [Waddliaceae bacterium]